MYPSFASMRTSALVPLALVSIIQFAHGFSLFAPSVHSSLFKQGTGKCSRGPVQPFQLTKLRAGWCSPVLPFSTPHRWRRTNLRGGGQLSMAEGNGEETLVQYVVLRRDLASEGWPMGSIVAQGCHAVSAALWEMREEANVVEYCKDIDNMHKVVLGARDEKTLRKVAQRLEDQGLKFRLWVEQPEDFATALAVMPYPRSTIAPHLKKLSLLK